MQKSQSWLMMVVAPAVMLRKVQELFRTFFCPVTIVGMLSLMTAKMAAAILSLAANALIIALEDIKKRPNSKHYNLIDILFPSNHNIHKSSYSLCFWASDPLIERF